MDDDLLRAAALRWIEDDPDYVSQQELRRILERSPLPADLADRFAGTLQFGTAGLRGVLGAGPNRMNRAVVIRTTCGLADVLLERFPDARTRGVVVGYDGRRLSREFAEDAACVLAGRGILARLFTVCGPTPLTAFACSKLGAVAAIMVTASHNPPEYNGYKVYWANAAQIIPPIDAEIAARIAAAPAAKAVARADIDDERQGGLIVDVSHGVERAYLDAIARLEVSSGGDRAMPIVYTPMHGVGNRLARAAFAEAGFTRVTSVPEQADPDGDFPTVRFPNPEESGALDLAFALARSQRAELVIANDPDADRLAVALKDDSLPQGYRQLTGNQVGVLLGHHVLARGANGDQRLVLASIVSSPMLGAIAEAMGVRYEAVLTGFKWIANRAMALEADEGLRFVFGYEEALGYTVGTVVRDKDGISAAVAFAGLAAELRAKGKSVQDYLEELYRTYGLYVSSQVSVTRKGTEGAAELRLMMDALRASKVEDIGGVRVLARSDFQTGERLSGKESTALTLPKTNMLAFELEGGHRIIARPSGTEPKVKFYFDVREPVGPNEPMSEAVARAQARTSALETAWKALAGV